MDCKLVDIAIMKVQTYGRIKHHADNEFDWKCRNEKFLYVKISVVIENKTKQNKPHNKQTNKTTG